MELNYHGPHLSNGIYMEYRHNLNCNMGVYERTVADQFLYSQQNAGSIRMFYVQDYLKYDLIPEHLSLTLAGGINRFFNVSSLYRHYLTSYTCGGNVQVYLGRWTLAGFADNGWKFVEGEQLGHDSPAVYFTATCRFTCSILSSSIPGCTVRRFLTKICTRTLSSAAEIWAIW